MEKALEFFKKEYETNEDSFEKKINFVQLCNMINKNIQSIHDLQKSVEIVKRSKQTMEFFSSLFKIVNSLEIRQNYLFKLNYVAANYRINFIDLFINGDKRETICREKTTIINTLPGFGETINVLLSAPFSYHSYVGTLDQAVNTLHNRQIKCKSPWYGTSGFKVTKENIFDAEFIELMNKYEKLKKENESTQKGGGS